MELLFVLGGGIGNIVQATPAIKAAAEAGHIVDLKLHCNSTNDVKEIFQIPAVRTVFLKENPPGSYDFQLNGPFTPGQKYKVKKHLSTRIKYAQHIEEAKVYFDLVKQIGINTEMPCTEVNIGSMSKNGPMPKNKHTVAIYPGSKHNWAMKRWDKYDLLASKFDNVVVVGTHQDIHSHGNPAWISRQWDWPENTEFFTGSLRESAFLISQCKLFVGNDGGLAHVAAATGIPTFVVFGPSSVVKNKPYAPNAYAVAINLPCRPCQFKAGPDGKQIFGDNRADCPHHMECMRSMAVDYVFEYINNMNGVTK